MNAILPGQARSRRDDRDASSASSAGAEISIKSGVSVQSSAARTGRSGIKLPQHRAIERELADIGRRRLGRQAAAGRDWSCNRRSGPRLASPPAGRFAPKPVPAAVPADPAVRRWPPRRGCRRRIPPQSAGPRSGPAPPPRAPRGRRRSNRRHCGRDTPARRRGGASIAMSGSDCSSRCTSVPRKSARARSAERFAGAEAFDLHPRRDRTGAAGGRRFAPAAAGVCSHSGSDGCVLAAASSG